MKADTRELKQVLMPPTQFVIPTFQRDYEWTEDGQWTLLFEDLVSAAERLTEARQTAQSMKKPAAMFEKAVAPHFLGAIVCDQLPSLTGGIDERAVIDGQQRLTTLMLLTRGVLDALVERGSDLVDQVRRLLWNPADLAKQTHQQYKLWPRRRDRDMWKIVMGDGAAPTGDHLYEQARRFFAQQAREAMTGEDGSDRSEALVHALLGLFKLVVIDLEDNDDAQVIFEVLNGRQTPLSASDLVKNLLFLRGEFTEDSDVEELYDTYWAEFDDPWWKVEIGRGHAARGRRDVVLSAWLTAATGHEVNLGHLYGEVRNYLATNELSTEEVLADIYAYARAYGRLHDRYPVEDARIQTVYQRINALEVVTATPLLLWLSTRAPATLSPSDHAAAVESVESWLMRRALVNANTRGYGRVFVEVLQAAQAAAGDQAITAAIVTALDGVGRARRWPTDEDIVDSFTTRRFYDGVLSRGRLRLLLSEIDRFLRAGNTKTEQGQFDYDVLQIEHVMPRNWRANWPVDVGDESERATAEERRQQHVDRIGNLTLITGSFNGSLSDSAWSVKRPALAQQSKLQINAHVGSVEDWDEDAITARAKELADIVIGIWRSPSTFSIT
ncbi:MULTISPECIES: DUF262 domain-containing protein [unclassified Gordonia (in: high G+C Gram-positive bacteria)]|uniref:DUF262 domain-containing protein n=1 Tax=unclassified Gordonia (in: high G+C Gram-positive bacteria) TaxID=2657482 RepID=UPI001CFBDF46|nr:DUF262 domain-containing protein [Gordonia sp. WA4-43]UCZ89285.1 DUF262 domain-containing HNH endonuclease family protein [Gordonia sp. WA4-43]